MVLFAVRGLFYSCRYGCVLEDARSREQEGADSPGRALLDCPDGPRFLYDLAVEQNTLG